MSPVQKEIDRLKQVKALAMVKRDNVVSSIKSIHSMALSASTDPEMASQFLVAITDVDSLWTQFKLEDDTVLESLVKLDESDNYVVGLPSEVRGIITASRAIADKITPKGAQLTDMSFINPQQQGIPIKGQQPVSNGPASSFSRLPEIPLPTFDGDFRYWPTFRDSFNTVMEPRKYLTAVDKMYHLIGCLRGTAADAVRGIPISSDNYELAWSTLENRFHRPRMVATALVDKLLDFPSYTQESLAELSNFTCVFSECMSLLDGLKIPDVGSFILFTLAFRRLPLHTRKLFETNTMTDFPSMNELLEFVKSRVVVLEVVGDQPRKTNAISSATKAEVKPGSYGTQSRKGGDRVRKAGPPNITSSFVTTGSSKSCPCCAESHALDSCNRIKSWSVEDRVRWLWEKKLCFICLSADHWANKCRSKYRCNDCNRRHHHLIHKASTHTRGNDDDSRSDAQVCASAAAPISKSNLVVLGTALVHARDKEGSWHTMLALIDSASQISAITVTCADRLGLKCARWTSPVTGLGGVPIVNVQGRVELSVQPRFAIEPVLAIHAWVLPSITADMPRSALPHNVKGCYTNLALADPSFDVPSPVDVLLGGDVFPSIMDGRKVVVDDNLPAAFSSVFGWVLIGPVSNVDVPTYHSMPVSLTVSIEGLMEKFWHVEEPVTAPESFTDEGRCESIFREEHVRLPSGRFSVPLPFRAPVSDDVFAGSRDTAVRRFESLERKLSRDRKLRELYISFMRDYLSLGHMSIATSPGTYYIPHHAVYRPEVDDSKLRVVFDASATNYQGPSLNSCLLPGPKLQQDIVDILTRFRVYRHAFTADIVKMYRQISVLPTYQKYQHILWRESPHDRLCDYELHTVVTYGVNCAPFLALRVLKLIADEDCGEFASVRAALTHQTYVDDICVGADTEQEALELQANLITVLKRSGLELKKWSANTSSVLDAIPVDSRGSGPLPFDMVDGYSTKMLGIEWHPDRDNFCCALRPDPTPVFTKRGILSLVARIFDPLGLFAPSTFLAKSIMQRTWCRGLSWDAPLPEDIRVDWAAFVAELTALITIEVPRYINVRQGSPCLLLGFCDASQLGYAAVAYVRDIDAPTDNCIFLLGSKTKLAPVKPLTVPRLELNAAVLLARWLGRLNLILAPQLNIVGIHAWSDSMIVLSWLNVLHESFKTYVSNRVHQVQTLIPTCQWHHIDSLNNPADCASRGVMPSVLAHLTLYWSGPTLIYTDMSGWEQMSSLAPVDELPELKPVVCTTVVDDARAEWFNNFSSFDRMIRVIARVRRFINCCRTGRSGVRPPEYLCKSELDDATRVLVLVSQRVYFAALRRELSNSQRISSKSLSKLSPFIDADSVFRVGGRLKHSLLTYDCKHPVLLAKESYFAKLLCERWHKITCHSGPRVMAALISRQYWVIALRSVLHGVMSRYTVCVRLNAQPVQPLMADLPAARVQRCRPFARVGVDFAGPLQMRDLGLRKARMYKVYIAVFVCFTVKAVHLEVVSDLSTESFLAAFDRFVARRGLPSDIYSDCGTNFVGANKQLHNLINSPENQVAIANSRSIVEWHFNPPSAPHFGGLWEAAVRSTKRLLVRVIGTHVLTIEEFTTVLTRIEAVLNSRPLTPASTDPRDLECITPGHFLIGQPLIAVPPRSTPDAKRNVRDRWKLLDQCHQAFWRRWSNEYLTTLQERSKWTQNNPNLNVNDMVVIIDNHSPPLMWRLGRVMEVTPGADGIVRVARVLTSTGYIIRPVVKLVLLPVE